MDSPQISRGFLDVNRTVALMGIAPGMHLADLGCGSGFFGIALAKAVGKDGIVSAVDIMEEPLQTIQSMAEAAGLGNIRFIRADLEVLGSTGIGDNTQDLALLANTLFQSEKKEAMIQEAIRMLKSGGQLVIIDWKKQFAGFGPSEALRTSEENMQIMAEKLGTKFDHSLDISDYHYCLIFKKI